MPTAPASLLPELTLEALRLGVPVTARTPASSANLGPGFDALALALARYDEVTVTAVPQLPGEPTVRIEVEGSGAGAVPVDERHLVVSSLRDGLAHAGLPRSAQPALHLLCRNDIPHGRGLGSSAAAISVGLVLARGLLTEPHREQRLSVRTVFDLAGAAEGHPDNASAALFGGCTLSWMTGPQAAAGCEPDPAGAAAPGELPHAEVVQLDLDPRIGAVLCLPDAELATTRARAMLPERVPHGDAAFNAARTGLLVHALAGRPDLLFEATKDRLHQDQRGPAMPATSALICALRAAGAAAVVSGAGPSVLVLGEPAGTLATVTAVLAGPGRDREQIGHWQVLPLAVDRSGTHLVVA